MVKVPKVLIVAIALLAAPWSAAVADAVAVPADAATLLDRAAKRFDLQREGSSPIRLRARVVATDAKGEKLEGNYHLLWVSPTAWLEEIAFPTFWEAAGRSGTRSWRKRKLEFTPEPVRWLRETVRFADRLERAPAWTGDPVEKKRVRGVEQTCAGVRPNGWSSRRWCFDPGSGDLFREDAEDGNDRGIVVVYGDWREAEGKRFPGKISYAVENRKRIELAVTEFEKVHEIDPSRFEPPQGAEALPTCESLRMPEAPQPVLEPPRTSGSAAVEARIGADGKVKRVQILSASSPEFARKFAAQIAGATFTPATCDGRPVEVDQVFQQSAR